MSRVTLPVAVFLSVWLSCVAAPLARAGELADYTPVPGVSGGLKIVGSDTLGGLVNRWAEAFVLLYPNVRLEIESRGSATAPAALVAGSSDLGPMSRPMSAGERRQFEARFGYPPVAVRVAIDALAVLVHRDNPLDCLSLPELDALFSSTRLGGLDHDLRRWRELGVDRPWAAHSVQLHGRNAASGSYAFFRQRALFGGDFKPWVRVHAGSAGLSQAVAADRRGIGYAGTGHAGIDTRILALAERPGDPCIELSPESTYSGAYPLARFLFIYVNVHPAETLDPLRAEFIRFIQSREGQALVPLEDYYPVTAAVVTQDQAALTGPGPPAPAASP